MLKNLAASAVLMVAAMPALAQNWPAQPIKYIVPFPPGGATDLISRPLTEKLQARLGQPVVIEYVGGAGASIGMTRLKQAVPNGYTIGLGNSGSHTITPHLLAKPPYDPLQDFTPISMLTEYANVLVVSSQSPARDMKEFLALARATPAGLTYGSAGNGSSNHLSAALLAQLTALPFVHVPYKGNSPAISDLMAGHIDWMFATISEVRPFLQAGRLRALGISSRTRDPLMPDLAPVADSVPGMDVVGFMGLFGPTGLPPATTQRLANEVNVILGAPDMVERLAAQGMRARASTPDELAARVKRDLGLWKSVVATAGLKPE